MHGHLDISALDARSYRSGFVEACLDQSPEAAERWYREFCAVVEAEIAPLAAEVDRTRRYPAKSVAALRRIGAFGVSVGREHGGRGFGDAMTALVVERLAAACTSTAAVAMFHYQVVKRVARYGHPCWQAEDLAKLASGAWMGSSAWTEMGAGAAKTSLATRLTGMPDRPRVTGEKHFCTGLEQAAVLHVLLNGGAPDGPVAPTFVRIPVAQPGVDVSDVRALLGLRGSSTGTIKLTDVPVEPDWIVGGIGQGGVLMKANHELLMNPGLLALGVSSAALELTGLGALGLSPGSRDITGFQATRFRLAEMGAKLAQAYALAADVIRTTSAQPGGDGAACLRVKLIASEAAVEIAGAAVRLAGGRGFCEDWPFERLLRDAHATVLMGPANELIKEQIAERAIADIDMAMTDSNEKVEVSR